MATSVNGTSANAPEAKGTSKRQNLRQTDAPNYSLDESLRVVQAIIDNYASQATSPLKVAKAMEMLPNSSRFRMLCGAANAYGLTLGGAYAPEISITQLGRRIFKPLEEGDDFKARREALLKPSVIMNFLRKYDSSPIPKEGIALNVLEEIGVPANRTGDVLSLIIEGAKSLGFIENIKGREYVDLSGASMTREDLPDSHLESETREGVESHAKEVLLNKELEDFSNGHIGENKLHSDKLIEKRRKVFVSHGKNKSFIEPIKKLLSFGELMPVVATETQSVSQPVPDKVMDDMRNCGAAIIHVDDEQHLFDGNTDEVVVLNQNVVVEIGAAMALYGRRYILLVKSGITLPSYLQGLFEVRYDGDSLDSDATIRLLEAIKDIKNHPLLNEE